MLKGVGALNQAAVAITGGTINGAVIGGTTPAAGSFTTLGASGVFTELKRASIYVYTGWNPTDVAHTLTNASSTAAATSSAASYITVANSSGTTTWSAVIAGLFRFSIAMENAQGAVITNDLQMIATLGGTATILLVNATQVNLPGPIPPTGRAGQPVAATSVFYANMTVGQTVTILPKIAVNSAGATTSYTTQCAVSAEYCGATAN